MSTTVESKSAAAAEASFTFQVASVRFANDKGYSIAYTTKGVSVSGPFKATVGLCYKAKGQWEHHEKYGRQFKLTSAMSIRMPNPQALGVFLVGAMKGVVGETVIGNLVEACVESKLDLEDMLDRNDLEGLIACVGTRNAKKMESLLDKWPQVKPKADQMSPLLGYGLTEAMATAAINRWGAKAIDVVETRPYELMLHIDGISFLTADRIAMKLGTFGFQHPTRLRAALKSGLRDATSMGDCGVRRETLLKKTMPLVNESVLENGRRKLAPGATLLVPESVLRNVLADMIKESESDEGSCGFSESFIESPDEKGELVVWLKDLMTAEDRIAAKINTLKAPSLSHMIPLLDDIERACGMRLSDEQRAAVEGVLCNPVSVITGGPGVGKSATLKVLLAVLTRAAQKGNQVAPTGKAAKRISEATKAPSQTVHSLLGLGVTGRANFGASNKLAASFIIMDETSMMDTELTAAAFDALKTDCRVIMVGDVDQLSSVGPGQVLRDIIRSNVVPVFRLTKGFRFSGGIATAARDIRRGAMPKTSDDGQFIFMETEEPHVELMAAVKKLLEAGVPESDIQILSPTHRGDAGCIAMNKAMQALVNEPVGTPKTLKRDSGDIRAGDRVIQTKNDKELGLVNGDIGWVDEISSEGAVTLSLVDRLKPVVIPKDKTQNLQLAYAITVHKSQGAEAPHVLMALDRSATFMLRRNLVYTGVTRGSKCVQVFSSTDTLSSAIRRGEPEEGSRRTMLATKIKNAAKGSVGSAPAVTSSTHEDFSMASGLVDQAF